MNEPYPKLLVEVKSHRERYVRVFGTPESLRILVSTLQRAVESLPPAVSERQSVSDFYVGDAGGSKQEVYLSFHAVPSLDYSVGRQRWKTLMDYFVILLLVVFVALAVIGVRSVWHWIL
jgi:hypothetical protein